MKLLALLALFLWQAAFPRPTSMVAERQYFSYERTITLPSGAGQNCIVLDASVFPHASPSLRDIRLYQQGRELPYALTLSEPLQADSDVARIFNAGMRGQTIVFDLQMPNRPYSDVILDLGGQDYIATATVTGKSISNEAAGIELGEFTLFDLKTQHLSHSTTLSLQESTFSYLHIELTVSPAPGDRNFSADAKMVQGASVPPSRESQSVYTTALETTAIQQRGRQTVVRFRLPARVPVERVSFVIAPEFKGNFSRDVHISDRLEGAPDSAAENIAGTILRVHLNEAGREVRQDQFSVPATMGSNLQSDAVAEAVVDNGDDIALPIRSVRLEMRERKLCFAAPDATPITMVYGDPALASPQYEYARLFLPSTRVRMAKLGPEQINSTYRPRPDDRPMTERHPDLLWAGLLIVICVLALVALRSAKSIHR